MNSPITTDNPSLAAPAGRAVQAELIRARLLEFARVSGPDSSAELLSFRIMLARLDHAHPHVLDQIASSHEGSCIDLFCGRNASLVRALQGIGFSKAIGVDEVENTAPGVPMVRSDCVDFVCSQPPGSAAILSVNNYLEDACLHGESPAPFSSYSFFPMNRLAPLMSGISRTLEAGGLFILISGDNALAVKDAMTSEGLSYIPVLPGGGAVHIFRKGSHTSSFPV